MIRNTLVLTVVALSALAPLAARSVQIAEHPEQRIVMALEDGIPAAVGQDLKDITPTPKPAVEPVDKTSIALGPAFDALVGVFLTFGSGIVGWLSWWKQKLFKAEMDTKQRELLHEGIKNGILYAAEKIKQRVGSGMKIDVGNEIIAITGQYMVDNSAKVLGYFKLNGLDKGDMTDLVTANAAKLGISLDTGKFVGAAG
jgi:hypothetical protein